MSDRKNKAIPEEQLKRLCGKKTASKGKTVLMIRAKLKEPTDG